MPKLTQANIQSIIAQELACCILLKVTQKEFNTIAETSNLRYCKKCKTWQVDAGEGFVNLVNKPRYFKGKYDVEI